MKLQSTTAALLVALVILAIPAPLQAGGDDPLLGKWKGALEAMGTQLRLVLTVESKDDGISAVLTSVDQGNTDLVVDTITLEDGKVTFEVRMVGGKFEGKLEDDKSTIKGEWSQAGNTLPLTLHKE
jgi:hypothetical protein